MTLPRLRPERARLRSAGVVVVSVLGLLLGMGVVALMYRSVPRKNFAGAPVDALLVLGTPAEIDGTVTLPERWRVDEAVREYKAGRATHVLFSGGAAANRFVEADVMARYAKQQGIPDGAVLEERGSRTTLENVRNSERMLEQHGWRRVEVISSPEHLPRAAVFLERTRLLWTMHAAPTPGRSRLQIVTAYAEEAIGTTAIRVFGTRAEPLLHGLAVVQHGAAFGVRWAFYRTRGLVRRVL